MKYINVKTLSYLNKYNRDDWKHENIITIIIIAKTYTSLEIQKKTLLFKKKNYVKKTCATNNAREIESKN